ncbi:tetratricopeptide repeat protein [Mucilaginibacter lutimaris]|uniref:Tetratricopeptide repeat protein n=1 Tax=Mucilaginibacter lutimaris TaxID=931629 RepID=A0ABW2ZFF9_9SPHI
MKIKFLILGLLSLVTATTFAQKSDINNAQSEYEKFESLRSQPILAIPSLKKAKESIDKAAANEKAATMPQMFAVKANVYATLAELDSVATTSLPLFTTAAEANAKAKELDSKGENKKLIDNANIVLARYQLNKGVKEYESGKYDLAYKSFDFFRTVMPEDTNAILYTGLAALNSKNYPAAITNYSKLVTTKYSKAENAYSDLVGIYLDNKDTTGAIKAIGEGLAKYPNNAALRRTEIEISLQQGKQKEVLDKILSAQANDPKNKSLYYYAGLVYSNLGDAAGQKIAKAPAASKAGLQATRDQNFAKATEMYKKALEIDPNYFEANLNMGYIIISPAIEIYNAANKLPTNQQKAYDAAMLKANAQFDLAKPYLLKAVELQPTSYDALNNLRTYYQGKKDSANAAKVTAQINALQKK